MTTIEIIFGNLIMILIAYLIGGLNGAHVIKHFIKSKIPKNTIKKQGSKNPGAANMGRIYGFWWGVAVYFWDFLKISIVMIIAILLAHLNVWAHFKFFQYLNIAIVGAFGILGHLFPIYNKFKGGKGFASFCGFMALISSWYWLLFLPLYVIFIFTNKKVSLSSILTVWTATIANFIPGFRFQFYGDNNITYIQANPWFGATIIFFCLAIIITLLHKDNIKRMLKGEERVFHAERFYSWIGHKLKVKKIQIPINKHEPKSKIEKHQNYN